MLQLVRSADGEVIKENSSLEGEGNSEVKVISERMIGLVVNGCGGSNNKNKINGLVKLSEDGGEGVIREGKGMGRGFDSGKSGQYEGFVARAVGEGLRRRSVMKEEDDKVEAEDRRLGEEY